MTANIARFAGATVVNSLKDVAITHVIIDSDTSSTETSEFRRSLSTRGGKKVPHIVTSKWIEECWGEKTLLDEESKFSCTLKASKFFFWVCIDSYCRVSTCNMSNISVKDELWQTFDLGGCYDVCGFRSSQNQ